MPDDRPPFAAIPFTIWKTVLAICTVLFCHVLSAQYTDSTPYYAGFHSSGTYNQTNAGTYYLLDNSLRLSARKKSMKYNFASKWLYGQQDEQLSNNDFSSILDVNLYKTFPHFNYWGLFSYLSSYSLKVNMQLQAGFGVAYNVIDRKNKILNISDGFIYDYSDVTLTDSAREKYGTVRNSFRVQLKWETGRHFTFNGNGFYQPSLQYANDYIIRSDMGLGIRLKKWLNITVAFSYNKINRTRTENVLTTYGFMLERYF
jgi:hypothetical protein